MIASVLACPGLRSGVGQPVVRWRADMMPRRSEAPGTAAEVQPQVPVIKRVLTINLCGWRRIRTIVVPARKRCAAECAKIAEKKGADRHKPSGHWPCPRGTLTARTYMFYG